MDKLFPTPPASLCLIRLSAIGDVCHTVPVVRTLQAAWPETAITWIVGKVEHGLLAGMEGVEFVVLDKRAGWRGYREVSRSLRGRRFPLLLHMHASARANLVSRLVRARIRLGFDRARARDQQWLFTNHKLTATPGQHVMDGLFEFTEALDIRERVLRWDIPLSAADRAFAATHIEAGHPTLLISPCTGQRFRNFRNWQVERYAAIADYAQATYNARIVVTGGNTALEREYADGIARLSHAPVTDLVGATTLKQLFALIERAAVVLCPDSGPAHMAVAAGTPVVGLYATSNRHRTGPYLSQEFVVDKYPDAVRAEYGSDVSALRWGQRVRHPEAMELIEITDVTPQLDAAFSRAANPS